MKRRATAWAALLLFTVSFTACDAIRGKARDKYYDTWEAMGREKREMLVKRVGKARHAQEEAQEQFEDALEEFQALVGHDGGDLEKMYDSLKSEYEKSESRAEAVRERIQKVENVAQSLFSEWSAELETFDNERYRRDSAAKLNSTRERYEGLVAIMNQASGSMDPVLIRLRDQVLYLKHNLNAQALGSLDQEAVSLKAEIDQLVADIQTSVSKAEEFIAEMEQTG